MSSQEIRHLVIAIVHEQEAPAIRETLVEAGLKVTQISSTGTLLQPGDAALLLGVTPNELHLVRRLFQESWSEQTAPHTPEPPDDSTEWHLHAVGVSVGGATLFVLPIERYEQILGQKTLPERIDNAL